MKLMFEAIKEASGSESTVEVNDLVKILQDATLEDMSDMIESVKDQELRGYKPNGTEFDEEDYLNAENRVQEILSEPMLLFYEYDCPDLDDTCFYGDWKAFSNVLMKVLKISKTSDKNYPLDHIVIETSFGPVILNNYAVRTLAAGQSQGGQAWDGDEIYIPESTLNNLLKSLGGATSSRASSSSSKEKDFIIKNNVLLKYQGSNTDVTIPNSVTSIGDKAFHNCFDLTSITIPNSVTSIGKDAFANCFNLTSITIPNSVTSINKNAFIFCHNLTSITIPNSVTSIGEYAFRGCDGLISVTLGNGITSIDEGVFDNCTSLTSITIPNSVTSIGAEAFCDCSSLTSITIPNSVTSINKNAFYLWRHRDNVNNRSLTIICSPGSYAERYAQESNLSVKHLNESVTIKEANSNITIQALSAIITGTQTTLSQLEVLCKNSSEKDSLKKSEALELVKQLSASVRDMKETLKNYHK